MTSFVIQKQKLLIIAFLAIILVWPVFAPHASAVQKAITGLDTAATQGYGTKPTGDIPTLMGRIIGAALSFIGLLFFLLVIYGGFLWMTARGNQQQVTQALDLIIAAVIGLIIVAAAYLITQYIGEVVLSTTVK